MTARVCLKMFFSPQQMAMTEWGRHNSHSIALIVNILCKWSLFFYRTRSHGAWGCLLGGTGWVHKIWNWRTLYATQWWRFSRKKESIESIFQHRNDGFPTKTLGRFSAWKSPDMVKIFVGFSATSGTCFFHSCGTLPIYRCFMMYQ